MYNAKVSPLQFVVAAVDLSELSRASKTRTSSIEFWLILRARNRTPPPCHT